MPNPLRATHLQLVSADAATRDRGVIAWLSFVVGDGARAEIEAYLLRQTGPHLHGEGVAA